MTDEISALEEQLRLAREQEKREEKEKKIEAKKQREREREQARSQQKKERVLQRKLKEQEKDEKRRRRKEKTMAVRTKAASGTAGEELTKKSMDAEMADKGADTSGTVSDVSSLSPAASVLPIESIKDGIICTTDKRYVKILEILPVNFLLRSELEQRSILYSFMGFLKISPVKMQIKMISKKANISRYLAKMEEDMEREEDERCRMLQRDYMNLIKSVGRFGIYNTNPFYQKEQGYYPVIAYQEGLNEDIRSSRMSGYLAAEKRGYLVYELLDQDILFRRSVEERTAELHRLYGRKSESNALLLSDNFSVADKILSRGSNGNGKSRIGLEPHFSHMYYYPHTADGFTELKFLLYPERIRKLEKELKSLIVSRAGSYAVMEGLDEEGAEIYFLFAQDLKKMGRMRAEIIPERKSRIFTLSFLAEFVERHFPHSEVFPFDEAKLPE